MPRINKIFAVLLPSIFPIAKSVLPVNDATMFTTNSGAEVPNETTVKPITMLDTFNRWAMEDAPSTNQWAPKSKPAILKRRMIKSTIESQT
jgi:hypothetical protein